MVEQQRVADVTVVIPGGTQPRPGQFDAEGSGERPRGRFGLRWGGRPARRRGWFGWIGVVLGWIALAAGLTGVGLHYSSGSSKALVLAASFASYLMIGAVLGLLILLLARAWRSAIAATLVTAAALWSQLPMLWPDGSAPPGVDVAVMQSNLLFGLADADAVVRAVRENRVEALTLEELTPEIVTRLDNAGIAEVLPYRYLEPAQGGQGSGILSRYPLESGAKLTGFLLNNVRATMIHPDLGRVEVFQFHPIPPNLDFGAWTDELRTIGDLLDRQPGKVIVGGDFNSTFDHSAYRNLLNDRYADAAELLGVGALPTWPNDRAWGPLLGLDRVLVAGGHATEIRSLTIPRSDHRAVVARLCL
ncbi:endonuclease/exonuclease/phosphatase family protein [Nocardia sp. NBC_01503]|uniref:endonuclease/exonuclease/phosphatase family protein n=1 Tax=Nocardia sp. NBC_01503 TaxID=2975997 RepID=UPI002E7B278A|nr:endonuclease/exonuclease/phosphatase family protein [Nocardia sp. NBC_01503]WTL29642.1 endonuclease/exonuclease/phosphatase family protein [Nocardia sp. NBC_01503]